jgi:hypothetical protein
VDSQIKVIILLLQQQKFKTADRIMNQCYTIMQYFQKFNKEKQITILKALTKDLFIF